METISLTAREYAEQNGIALPTAYLWLKKAGLKPKAPEHGGQNTVGKYDKLLRQYREQGLKYYEIAKILGKDHHNIATRCRQLGLGYSEEEKPQPEYERRIKEKGFEYILGYENRESIITIKCLKCGELSQRRYRNLIESKGTCPKCQRINHEARQKEKEIRKEIREQEVFWKKYGEGKQTSFKVCPVCNSLFTGYKKYCSEICSKRQQNKNHDIGRRLKVKKAMVDKGISLEKLYRRDRGQCYICGKACDWNDYQIIDGAFIAGKTYPSIDHVIPLAKDGEHSWENVKLAHFVCNSLKSDKI